jgi:hypothetical protein
LHPVKKEAITKYKQLIDDPLMRNVWLKTTCKELGRLTQRYGEKRSQYYTERTKIMRFLYHEGIGKILRDRVVTYARIVDGYCAQKKDPTSVRITIGGNQLKGVCPGELTTYTSVLTTSKFMWNSVLSTPGACYICVDARNVYLAIPLE